MYKIHVILRNIIVILYLVLEDLYVSEISVFKHSNVKHSTEQKDNFLYDILTVKLINQIYLLSQRFLKILSVLYISMYTLNKYTIFHSFYPCLPVSGSLCLSLFLAFSVSCVYVHMCVCVHVL